MLYDAWWQVSSQWALWLFDRKQLSETDSSSSKWMNCFFFLPQTGRMGRSPRRWAAPCRPTHYRLDLLTCICTCRHHVNTIGQYTATIAACIVLPINGPLINEWTGLKYNLIHACWMAITWFEMTCHYSDGLVYQRTRSSIKVYLGERKKVFFLPSLLPLPSRWPCADTRSASSSSWSTSSASASPTMACEVSLNITIIININMRCEF